ncbi:MAG: trigger factor family protein, partial [Myxococcales bacterium]|nr:trigger factor family protein [Myxococcales bacterium]
MECTCSRGAERGARPFENAASLCYRASPVFTGTGSSMQSELERISAVECRVRVAIPWTDVSPRWEAKLRDLRKRANVPGFRRGKV